MLTALVARQRGVRTPERENEILAQMRDVTDPSDDLAARLVVIRHAADQAAPDPDLATRSLAPLLRDQLTHVERDDLCRMLTAVATVHQGPTASQNRFIEQVRRAIYEDR